MNILFVVVYLIELMDELLHFMKYLCIHNVHEKYGSAIVFILAGILCFYVITKRQHSNGRIRR
jgi:hypothetical protein